MPSDKAAMRYAWGTPEKVFQATDLIQRLETVRAIDRAKVNALANGSRPYSESEMKEYGHQLNVNWLEMTRKLQDAIGQINNAFLPPGNFFTAHCVGGEPDKREMRSQVFTKLINQMLKDGDTGQRFHHTLRSRNASVALHGIGPLMWTNATRLLPRYVPLEDLLIPTDTLSDLTVNLSYFAVNLYMTPGEMFRMAFMGQEDSGWNRGAVERLIRKLTEQSGMPFFPPNVSDWQNRPEAVAEIWKQNGGYWESDAVPKARLRAFYYQDPEKQVWHRKVIQIDPLETDPNADKQKFLYDKESPFADSINHVLQIQFGDNSIVPPLKYHSVRGIGTMLYGPCLTLNRLRSTFIQGVFRDQQVWWRINDPQDRDRPKQMLMMNNGVIPEGVEIVPNVERYQSNPQLVEMALAQLKQNIGENSTSYSPSVDTGTNKERTKFEVQAQLQSATAMVGNVLSMMYAQEKFMYRELVRRALIPTTDDPAAKEFQKDLKREGITGDLLEADNWNITADRVLGAGDRAIAQMQADALMTQRQSFEPEAQRKIQRLWVATTLDDWDRAFDLVPPTPEQGSSGTRCAEEVFGTLMEGVMVPMRKGIDHVGYCAALLKMMGTKIEQIMNADGMGTPADIMGFQAVSASVSENLAWLAQNPQNKEVVRQLADALGQQSNMIKAMAQRQAEAAQKAQQDPVEMLRLQMEQMKAQQDSQISGAKAQQEMEQRQMRFEQEAQQKQARFEQDMMIKMQEAQGSQARDAAATDADLRAQGATTAADVRAIGAKTGAEVSAIEKKSDAEVRATDKKSEAAAKASAKAAAAKPKTPKET